MIAHSVRCFFAGNLWESKQVYFMTRIAALCVVLLAAAHIATATVGFSNCTGSFVNGFIPTQPTGAVQVCRGGAIAISYDVKMIGPAWSAYFVTYAEVSNEISGRDSFYEDPDLLALDVKQAAVNSDAFNTSWNRGHLAPNHILSYTDEVKRSTFTMANVCPQEATFNQQPWNQLEADVFNYITKSKVALHIVTGVAYKNRNSPRRTFDGIAVPDYYFKVVCDVTNKKSAGFYGSNTKGGTVAQFYSVKEVEALYGGTLFPATTCNTGTVDPSQWWTL